LIKSGLRQRGKKKEDQGEREQEGAESINSPESAAGKADFIELQVGLIQKGPSGAASDTDRTR